MYKHAAKFLQRHHGLLNPSRTERRRQAGLKSAKASQQFRAGSKGPESRPRLVTQRKPSRKPGKRVPGRAVQAKKGEIEIAPTRKQAEVKRAPKADSVIRCPSCGFTLPKIRGALAKHLRRFHGTLKNSRATEESV
jgi:uncharacterized C2H2 Zn-finger protein